MSLRVWLPLTKDLRNQGLDTVTVTQNNGTAISSGGKLGSCLTATSNATVVVNLPSLATMLANGKSYSLACWVKITGNVTTSSWIIKLGTNNCGLWWAASEARWVWNENDNGKRCANPTISSDTTNWHHLVTTVTKSSNGSVTTAKHYVDGIPATSYETQTWNGSGNAQPTGTTITISPYAASLNDIRLYDHCLSPMEVKELAKGLVLHYPLNRQGWGQENLVTGTNPNDWHSLTLTDKINQCINIFGDTTRGYLQATTAGLEVGDVVHVSFDIKFSSDITATNTGTNVITVQGSANNGATWGGLSYSATGNGGIQRTEINNIINSSSKQGHIHTWFIVTSAMLDGTYTGKLHTNIRFDYYTGTVYVKATKVEKGINATPWCPNSADTLYTTMGLNSTTEYDCSGFCNNGTRTGTFTWTSDTPKYAVSTKFNGTNATIDCGNAWHSQGSLELTFSAWVYVDDWESGDANYYLSSQQTGGIILQSLATSNNIRARIHAYTAADFSTYSYYQADCTYANTGISGSGWHMLTGVYTPSSIKLYIDGILKKTTSLTTYGIHFNDTAHMFLAAESTGTAYSDLCNCKLSDVRIYATALSADDVKSLYQNCATIDPDGTIRGQIRS